MRERMTWILAALLLVSGLGMAAPDSASAAAGGKCRWETVEVQPDGIGAVRYERVEICPAGVAASGNPSAGGSGAPAGPPCDLGGVQLEITPGDGSASFSCAWVTGKSDQCRYTYRRASVGGPLIGANGRPAYRATGAATWTLRFENNGAPVPIAGAPTEISGLEMTSAVEVGEVQTLVTGVR